MLIIWLLLGVLGAIVLSAIARRGPENQILALGLIVAALFYVMFAFVGDTSTEWQWIEFLGVGIYGLCALLGVMVSPWWLMLGWLLHPVWDVCLHFFNSGSAFTPEWYVLMCIGFDVLVATNIAVRQLGGMCMRDQASSPE